MDYEKRIREYLNNDDVDELYKSMLLNLFPELKESEEEKIRKALIECVEDYKAKGLKEFFGVSIDNILAWLEKQYEKKSTDNLTQQEAMDIAVAKCFNEQDAVDKVKHKFNVGDWIIFAENHNSIYQVERIDNYRYYLRHYLGGTLSLHFDNELIRLWTLQDAKDGDILVSSNDGRPFIFKGCLDPNHPNCPVAYCGIDTEDIFLISTNKWWADEEVHPATKEQRDLLSQKMKEAGYTFDFEKKELKNIEQKSAWSEVDDAYKLFAISAIEDYYDRENPLHKDLVDWFESLKNRCVQQSTWKPSDEQIIALRWVLNNIPYNKHKEEISGLLDQIKDL